MRMQFLPGRWGKASRLKLWEGQYAPTGLSSNRLKGVHILDHYVSMDEYDQNRDAR